MSYIPFTRHVLTAVIVLALGMAAIPALRSYYQTEKAATGYITDWLAGHVPADQKVFIYPDFEERNYSYYLPKWGFTINPPIPVHPEEFESGEWNGSPLVTGALTAEELLTLQSLGYRRAYTSPPHVIYGQSIWLK